MASSPRSQSAPDQPVRHFLSRCGDGIPWAGFAPARGCAGRAARRGAPGGRVAPRAARGRDRRRGSRSHGAYVRMRWFSLPGEAQRLVAVA
jgi:hypothetical protein